MSRDFSAFEDQIPGVEGGLTVEGKVEVDRLVLMDEVEGSGRRQAP